MRRENGRFAVDEQIRLGRVLQTSLLQNLLDRCAGRFDLDLLVLRTAARDRGHFDRYRSCSRVCQATPPPFWGYSRSV